MEEGGGDHTEDVDILEGNLVELLGGERSGRRRGRARRWQRWQQPSWRRRPRLGASGGAGHDDGSLVRTWSEVEDKEKGEKERGKVSVELFFSFLCGFLYPNCPVTRKRENRSRTDPLCALGEDRQLGRSDRQWTRHSSFPFYVPSRSEPRHEMRDEGGGRDRLRRSASPTPSPAVATAHPPHPPDYLTVKT